MPAPSLGQLELCTFCPKMCRHTCPVSEVSGHESYTPQAKMAALHDLRRGGRAWTKDHAAVLWACTGCGRCTTACAHGNEPAQVLFEGRADAVRRGAAPRSLDRILEHTRDQDALLATAVLALPFPRATSGALAVLPGCDALETGTDEIAATFSILERLLGMKPVLPITQRPCAGAALLAAGQLDAFRWTARRVATELSGFNRVVVSCAPCLHALRTIYPAEGIFLRAQVMHLSEILESRADALVAPPERRTFVYHDPCYLAGRLGVVTPPRLLLSRVATLRELPWKGANADCCGAAGGLPQTLPDVAAAMARRRWEQDTDRDQASWVTSCAGCRRHLAANAPVGRTILSFAEALVLATAGTAGTSP